MQRSMAGSGLDRRAGGAPRLGFPAPAAVLDGDGGLEQTRPPLSMLRRPGGDRGRATIPHQLHIRAKQKPRSRATVALHSASGGQGAWEQPGQWPNADRHRGRTQILEEDLQCACGIS
jgi:hypothetical protein